jgi:hypothetical protein
MAMGATCPHCENKTFHDNGRICECSACGAVGWSWKKGVTNTGSGKGKQCPNCNNHTLHQVGRLAKGNSIRRCGIYDYSLIEP